MFRPAAPNKALKTRVPRYLNLLVEVMPKRPAHCYSRVDRPPYTRKRFIRGGPEPKIRAFSQGNRSKDFPVTISLFAEESVQISHSALEAARVHVNRYLNDNLGRDNYYYKICVYPFHVLRENKMMTGAGADRLQDGMRKSFGKPVGSAARVKPGTRLLTIGVDADPKALQIAREALARGKHKFPCPSKVEIEKGAELIYGR